MIARHPTQPTVQDITQWNLVLLPDNTYFKLEDDGVGYDIAVGVFGWDLAQFMGACRVSRECNHELYDKVYDGWLVGCYMQMDMKRSWWNNYEYMLVCMQDNACFGLETYYTTHYSLELRYYIDPYAFYEYETLDRNVPSAGFEN